MVQHYLNQISVSLFSSHYSHTNHQFDAKCNVTYFQVLKFNKIIFFTLILIFVSHNINWYL